MDLIIFGLSTIFFFASISYYLDNTEEKLILVFPLICLLLFGWALTANIVKEPIVSHHKVQNLIAEDGSNYQVISQGNSIINLNSATGKVFEPGQIIEVKNYSEVWSLGIFCLVGYKEFSIVSERLEE